jgi:hypothetical protein
VATPRPYGLGPYGTGPYSVNSAGGTVWLVAGASGIVFSVSAQFRLTLSMGAVSGITFAALATRPQLTFSPAAVSGIVFTLTAELEMTWPGWAPCEDGAWQPAGPCEDGTWTTPPPCGTGSWGEIRLETLP